MEFGFLDPAPSRKRFPNEWFSWLLSDFRVVKKESTFGALCGVMASLLGLLLWALVLFFFSFAFSLTALALVSPLILTVAFIGFRCGIKWAKESAHYSEIIVRKADQVAVAFGLTNWQHMQSGGNDHYFDTLQSDFATVGHFGGPCEEFFFSVVGEVKIGWWMSPNMRPFEISVQIKKGKESTVAQLSYDQSTSKYELLSVGAIAEAQNLMARGLYRLGFEDEAISSQLPPLTNHEKLELRVSMPREFWPRTWLDEEKSD
jgi:hypothetical protein